MKRLFLLSVALLTIWAAAAQVRFVDATTLNLIGKAQPTSQPYHRIDTVVYKGFTKSENQQVRCSAGLALVFKTNSSRIDLLPEYTSFVYNGSSTPRVASEGFDLYIRKGGEWAIIHRCKICGVLHSNRVAADDNPMLLMSLAVKPLAAPPFPLDRLERAAE